MSGAGVILVVALVLRTCGAALRNGNLGLPTYSVGWILSTTAAWLAVGAAGAWFSLWPVLLLAMTGSFVGARADRRVLYIAGDVVVVVLSGLLSIPPLDLVTLVGTVIGVAGGGFIIDSMANTGR